jgi:hypothetical protein
MFPASVRVQARATRCPVLPPRRTPTPAHVPGSAPGRTGPVRYSRRQSASRRAPPPPRALTEAPMDLRARSTRPACKRIFSTSENHVPVARTDRGAAVDPSACLRAPAPCCAPSRPACQDARSPPAEPRHRHEPIALRSGWLLGQGRRHPHDGLRRRQPRSLRHEGPRRPAGVRAAPSRGRPAPVPASSRRRSPCRRGGRRSGSPSAW